LKRWSFLTKFNPWREKEFLFFSAFWRTERRKRELPREKSRMVRNGFLMNDIIQKQKFSQSEKETMIRNLTIILLIIVVILLLLTLRGCITIPYLSPVVQCAGPGGPILQNQQPPNPNPGGPPPNMPPGPNNVNKSNPPGGNSGNGMNPAPAGTLVQVMPFSPPTATPPTGHILT
jgi:hypothetical protein